MSNRPAVCVHANAGIAVALAFYFFLIPAGILVCDLRDPGLKTGDIPRFTFRWHRQLSGKFEAWARRRVAGGKAADLDTRNISGTEWPMYSAVFYLWATENLQESWERAPTTSEEMPKAYARGAIEAAASLIGDRNHASWVREQWGEDYLHREDVFYRMLLISGLTSAEQLLGKGPYDSLLRDQVDSLSSDLDHSPYGLLDDYPGQCYPVDILPAIAAIRRADSVIGTDHSVFAKRAIRAFEGARLDPDSGLPAYIADSKTGQGFGPARGVGLSTMLIWAPELWPETARGWYKRYDDLFWRKGDLLAGFREFSRLGHKREWMLEIDAGPVVAGYGTAASGFGIGAARANGRFDQAYPLGAEALVASWPLPDGIMLGSRLLSDLTDAPYTGEAALLFALTRRPPAGFPCKAAGTLPTAVYVGLTLYSALGFLVCAAGIGTVSRWRRRGGQSAVAIPSENLQVFAWVVLIATGAALLPFYPMSGVLALILAQLLPRAGRPQAA
jgi:hypothetical protein